MNFLSMVFIVALPVIFALYNFIPGKLRPTLLLLASWGFYLYGSPESFWILILITVISYVFGRFLDKQRSRIYLAMGISFILGFLIVFKYTGFGLVLPIGISFYTFQTISYLIDIYRNTYNAEKNFWNYSLFVSFFPQLVAGPIERPKNLIPQLKNANKASASDLRDASVLLATGYYKKIVIADFVAPLVDNLFDNPDSSYGPVVLIGSILFSMQIYADFSGYSDIARGCAKLFGINLSLNFDHPYLSVSIREFWRKWHITLTRWFTDYIYIPLGGNKKNKTRTAINTIIVFTLSGIWHGAGLSFIIWGISHGILMLIEEIEVIKKLRSRLPRFINILLNFTIVNFLWIFFRAQTLAQALKLFTQLFTIKSSLKDISADFKMNLLFATIGCLSLYLLPKYTDDNKNTRFVIIFLMLLITVFTKMYQIEAGIENAFIYFRF